MTLRLPATFVVWAIACGIPGSASAGTWSASSTLGPVGGELPQAGVTASGETVVAWTTTQSSRGQVEVALRPPGGVFNSARRVSGPIGLDARLTFLATNARGDAVVLFVRERERSLLAFRPAGGAFESPEELPPGGLYSAAALDADGDALLLQRTPSAVRFVLRRAAGGYGEPEVIAGAESAYADSFLGIPAVLFGVDDAGNATAAWKDGDIFVAERPSGGTWGPAEALVASVEAKEGPALAVGPRGDVVVAWTASGPDAAGQMPPPDYTGNQVVAALRNPGGEFGAPERISGFGGVRPPVADIDRYGNAAVAWAQTPGVHAALKLAGQPFAPPESVGGSNRVWSWALPAVHFDSSTGRPLVIWETGSEGGTVRMLSSERRASGWSAVPEVIVDPGPTAPYRSIAAGGRPVFAWSSNGRVQYSDYDSAANRTLIRVASAHFRPRRFKAGRGKGRGSTLELTVTEDTGLQLLVAPDDPNYGPDYQGVRYVRARKGVNKYRFTGIYPKERGGGTLVPRRYKMRIRPTGPGPLEDRVFEAPFLIRAG